MEQLNELKTLYDTNKWSTILGKQVCDVFVRSGHLISEDITFIDTLIDCQMDFQSNKDCLQTNTTFFNNHILVVLMTTSGLIWLESNLLSYQPLLGSAILGISWKSSSILYNLLNKIYLKHQLIQKSEDLSERLTKESHLIKKYFKLIEDYEVVEDSGKHLVRICEMKDKFRTFCWNCFKRLREITLNLKKTYRLNSEIDDEINYLCCLPIETFEKFISDDSSVISLSVIKSLMHLKRLQQSECFRRIICLFMAICSNEQTNDGNSDQLNSKTVCKQVIKIFDSLIEELRQTYPKLLSNYECAKSLWISSEKSLIKCRDLKQTNQTIEEINLLNANRNIRKHLLTSLNILDDCDSLIEDVIQCKQFRSLFRQKLDSINSEFKCLNDFVICLEKMLRIEELKESTSILSNKINLNEDNSDVKPNQLKVEEYVVTDQVFEAIVTEDFEENDLNPNDDQFWELKLKSAQHSDASNSLFKELKVALKSKAVEHKKREAKALGIELEENNEQSDNETSEGSEQPINDRSLEQPFSNSSDSVDSKSTEIQNQNNLSFNPNSFGFQSQMATIAAQKARLFATNKQTENFGDDSDSEDISDEE